MFNQVVFNYVLQCRREIRTHFLGDRPGQRFAVPSKSYHKSIVVESVEFNSFIKILVVDHVVLVILNDFKVLCLNNIKVLQYPMSTKLTCLRKQPYKTY